MNCKKDQDMDYNKCKMLDITSLITIVNGTILWNLNNLPFNLPRNFHDQINALALSYNNNTDSDLPYWNQTPKGNFTIKYAYNFILKDNTENVNLTWIWKTYNHPREQIFLWKCLLNGIPISAKLNRMNILPSPICPLCDSLEESIIHILRDCHKVRKIWLPLPHPPNFFRESLATWLQQNAKDHSFPFYHLNNMEIQEPQSLQKSPISTKWRDQNRQT